jgi:hypothetical protein
MVNNRNFNGPRIKSADNVSHEARIDYSNPILGGFHWHPHTDGGVEVTGGDPELPIVEVQKQAAEYRQGRPGAYCPTGSNQSFGQGVSFASELHC